MYTKMCIAFNRMSNTGANLHCSNFTQKLKADNGASETMFCLIVLILRISILLA